MNEFKASNHWVIRDNRNGGFEVRADDGHPVLWHVTPDTIQAVGEYWEHQKDKELGRWRSLLNPDYLVYSINGAETVFNERTGKSARIPSARASKNSEDPQQRVLYEYYEATPDVLIIVHLGKGCKPKPGKPPKLPNRDPRVLQQFCLTLHSRTLTNHNFS